VEFLDFTIRIVPKSKNTTPSEQFQNPKIPHHQNSSKFQKYHTIRTVPKSTNPNFWILELF
jgi:hypothetical protein